MPRSKRQKIRAGQWKAPKPPLPKPVVKADQLVQVILSIGHQINEMRYGPGAVSVTRKVASVLREQERRYSESEDMLHSNDRAFMIGAGNRKIRVHPDAFQAAWTEGVTFHGVAGGGNYR